MKYTATPSVQRCERSPSMRREWIEIAISESQKTAIYQSPSMRREWIEMRNT